MFQNDLVVGVVAVVIDDDARMIGTKAFDRRHIDIARYFQYREETVQVKKKTDRKINTDNISWGN